MTAARTRAGVSGPALADHLDLTKQRVGQLVDEGVLTKLPDGSFDLDACRLAYIRWLRSDDRRAVKSEAESRVRDARAAEIEMRIEERSGALVSEAVREALGVIDEYAGPLRSDLQAMVPRVTNDLALRRRMETEINQAFGAAARRAAVAADAAETSPATQRPNRAARRGARHGTR